MFTNKGHYFFIAILFHWRVFDVYNLKNYVDNFEFLDEFMV